MPRSGQFSLQLGASPTLILSNIREGLLMHASFTGRAKGAVPLDATRPAQLKTWLGRRDARDAKWLRETRLAAKTGELRLVPSRRGGVGLAVLGLGDERDPLVLAAFPESLPEGVYVLRDVP